VAATARRGGKARRGGLQEGDTCGEMAGDKDEAEEVGRVGGHQ
jgi:general stress protein YciG